VRSWILDFFETNPDRPIDAKRLAEALNGKGWQVSLSQVNYHLRWLSDADLVPAPCHGG
jgi:repressor of nif and glnA expression